MSWLKPSVVGMFGMSLALVACSGGSEGPQGGIDDGRGASGGAGGGGSGASSSGGGAGPGGGDWSTACGARVSAPPGPTTAPYCPPIDEMIAWMVGPPECPDGVYPTLRELECNAAELPRNEMSRGAVGVTFDGELDAMPGASENFGRMGDTRWVLDLTDEFDGDFPSELSIPSVTGLPPHFEFRGPNGTVDWESEQGTFQASVRAYGAEVLRQRAKGRPVLFAYGLGPHEPQPGAVADVDELIETVMVPRTQYVARVAEAVNAELLLPFAGEADILANAPGFRDLPAAERVQHVQHLVDRVRETARENFSGKLVGASAWQYYPANDPFWGSAPMDQVSWVGFDIVSFTMLPVNFNNCSVDFTRGFFQAQLAKIDELAQRDGFDWMVGELDIFTFGYLSEYTAARGCVDEPRDVFLPIWDETLAPLLAAPRRPAAAYFMAGPAIHAPARLRSRAERMKLARLARGAMA
jgi:hypothetical protein